VDGKFEEEIQMRMRELEKSYAVQEAHLQGIMEKVDSLSRSYSVLNDHHLDTQKTLAELCTRIETVYGVIKFGFIVLGGISTLLGIVMYMRGLL
jgi:hypothetical protein